MRPEVDERSVAISLVARDGMRLRAMFWHFGGNKIVRVSERYHATGTSFERLMRVCGGRMVALRPDNIEITTGSGGLDHLAVDIIVRGRLDGGLR